MGTSNGEQITSLKENKRQPFFQEQITSIVGATKTCAWQSGGLIWVLLSSAMPTHYFITITLIPTESCMVTSDLLY